MGNEELPAQTQPKAENNTSESATKSANTVHETVSKPVELQTPKVEDLPIEEIKTGVEDSYESVSAYLDKLEQGFVVKLKNGLQIRVKEPDFTDLLLNGKLDNKLMKEAMELRDEMKEAKQEEVVSKFDGDKMSKLLKFLNIILIDCIISPKFGLQDDPEKKIISIERISSMDRLDVFNLLQSGASKLTKFR